MSKDYDAFKIFRKEQRENVLTKLHIYHSSTYPPRPDQTERLDKELEKMWKALSEKEKNVYVNQAKERVFDYTKFVPKNYIPWDGIIRTMYEDYSVSEIPEYIQEYRMRLMPLEEAATTAELFKALEDAKFTDEDYDKIASNTLDWIHDGSNVPNYFLHKLAQNVNNQNRLLFMLRFFEEFKAKTNKEVNSLQLFIVQAVKYDRKLADTLHKCYGTTDENATIFDFDCIPHFIEKNDIETVQYLLQYKVDMKGVIIRILYTVVTPEMWNILFEVEISDHQVCELLEYTTRLELNPIFLVNIETFVNYVKRHKKYQKGITRFYYSQVTDRQYYSRNRAAFNLLHDFCFDFSELHRLSFLADRPLQVEKDGKKYEIRLIEKTE